MIVFWWCKLYLYALFSLRKSGNRPYTTDQIVNNYLSMQAYPINLKCVGKLMVILAIKYI